MSSTQNKYQKSGCVVTYLFPILISSHKVHSSLPLVHVMNSVNPLLGLWPMKTEPIFCPVTSVRNYHYSLRNSSEECSSQRESASQLHVLFPCDPFNSVLPSTPRSPKWFVASGTAPKIWYEFFISVRATCPAISSSFYLHFNIWSDTWITKLHSMHYSPLPVNFHLTNPNFGA